MSRSVAFFLYVVNIDRFRPVRACCNAVGVTPTAAPAPPRLAAAGFAAGAAAAAVAPPLTACRIGNEAGDHGLQAPPVKAFFAGRRRLAGRA